jgi:hypothetical protein
MTVVSNRLDLVLFLIIDKVGWRSREVLPILFRFLIGHEEGGMESGVYGPLGREAQLVDDWGYHPRYLEGSMPSGGELDGPIWQGKVLCIQPHLLTLFPLRFFGVVVLRRSIQGLGN